MLEDKTDGHLDKVKEFAEKAGKLDDLEKRLNYLGDYAQQETRCLLYKDFAPMSFYFQMQTKNEETDEWQNWFNGGLIWHGSHDGFGSGAAPTFSVCLESTDGWSIHT
ncbi:MAG: hypothetical protein DRJ03_02015 [Chloroflexi bacterium]|nr:MAG: hypothetical protein DRJ03_02015 [Chloroflexota bacterium]